MPNYYPIMLDIRNRPVIVIGGDRVAAEKAAALSASGANVTVINAEFCSELQEMAERQEIILHQKAYEPGDLVGAFVVLATATYDPQLAEAIWNEAQERGQLVNIVDVPARCSFIIPSILRRGQLTISVSTEGASPSLSKRIRQSLEDLHICVVKASLTTDEMISLANSSPRISRHCSLKITCYRRWLSSPNCYNATEFPSRPIRLQWS